MLSSWTSWSMHSVCSCSSLLSPLISLFLSVRFLRTFVLHSSTLLLSPRLIRIFEKIKTFLLNSAHNVPSLVCIYRSLHIYIFYLRLKASSVRAVCFDNAPRCHYVPHSHTQVCELDDRRGSEALTSQLKPSFYGKAFWRWINSYNQPCNVCGKHLVMTLTDTASSPLTPRLHWCCHTAE